MKNTNRNFKYKNNPPYSEYSKNPNDYDFLKSFKEKWEIIRDEYFAFINDKTIDHNIVRQIMSPKTLTIKENSGENYSAIGLLFSGYSVLDFIKKHNMAWSSISIKEVEDTITYINKIHFKTTFQCIKEATKNSSKTYVRTVYFSTFKKDMDIKLHTNNNFHTYRAYLGLDIPSGDVAIKVCGHNFYWQNGEYLVLDHTYPHCPHNYTDKSRTVLIVDFLRPDEPYEKMAKIEEDIVNKRMKDNIYSFGVFGNDDKVSDETFYRYGLEHQLKWEDKDLTSK